MWSENYEGPESRFILRGFTTFAVSKREDFRNSEIFLMLLFHANFRCFYGKINV